MVVWWQTSANKAVPVPGTTTVVPHLTAGCCHLVNLTASSHRHHLPFLKVSWRLLVTISHNLCITCYKVSYIIKTESIKTNISTAAITVVRQKLLLKSYDKKFICYRHKHKLFIRELKYDAATFQLWDLSPCCIRDQPTLVHHLYHNRILTQNWKSSCTYTLFFSHRVVTDALVPAVHESSLNHFGKCRYILKP